jgi:hypothetical protein
LFERFIIPSSASLHLHYIPENCPTHSDHRILPLIPAAYFHQCSFVEFKCLKVTAHNDDLMEVVTSIPPVKSIIYGQPGVGGDMDSEAELTLSFDGLPKSAPSRQSDILGQVCDILPTSNLEFLSISVHGTTQMESVNWYELFLHCKNITTIQARGRGTCGLLQSLAPPKHADASSCSEVEVRHDNRLGATHAQVRETNNAGSSRATATTATTTPFPKLACLLLEDLSLKSPISNFHILADALRWRKMNNSPVTTLSMHRCIITSSCANRLRKYVQEFRWDGEGMAGRHFPRTHARERE